MNSDYSDKFEEEEDSRIEFGNVNDLSYWNDEVELSLSERQRQNILWTPFKNKRSVECFHRAKLKLRGYLMWTHIHRSIKIFGCSSNLSELRDISLSSIFSNKLKNRHYKTTTYAKRKKCLFHPNSKFIQIWNLLMLFLLIYVLIFTPWIIAFEDLEMHSELFYLELSVDFLFFCDILVTLNTAFYVNDRLEIGRVAIFKNYLTGLLLVDFIAIFPFYLFSESNFKSNSLVRIIRITRLVRVFRASKLYKIFKHFAQGECSFFSFVRSNRGVVKIIKGVFLMLIMAHITACMWYFTAKLDNFAPDTWVVRNGMTDKGKWKTYLASLYWAFTIITTVGFGDIHPVTSSEMILCIFWLLFGIGFYTFLVGTLTYVLTSMDATRSEMNSKMKEIERFGLLYKLPKKIVKQMKKEISFRSEHEELYEQKRIDILSKLSKGLQRDLCLSMNDRAADRIDFIKKQDTVFIVDIVPRLEYIFVPSLKMIFKKGDFADAVYFITDGNISFLMEEEMEFKTIIKGGYFGEIEIIKKCPRLYSAKTKTNCNFLVMYYNVFEEVLQNYSKTAAEIMNEAEIKHTKDKEFMMKMIHIAGNIVYTDSASSVHRTKRRSFSSKQKKALAGQKRYSDIKVCMKNVSSAMDAFFQ